ncbi:MAG: hypothetical protein DRR19_32355 [Candidatus Parabeggiatoa sp. nov. 1]|nr:MAG: hypothetical protein DRR19_32355 [Gammaproteobacteria bacterium]
MPKNDLSQICNALYLKRFIKFSICQCVSPNINESVQVVGIVSKKLKVAHIVKAAPIQKPCIKKTVMESKMLD